MPRLLGSILSTCNSCHVRLLHSHCTPQCKYRNVTSNIIAAPGVSRHEYILTSAKKNFSCSFFHLSDLMVCSSALSSKNPCCYIFATSCTSPFMKVHTKTHWMAQWVTVKPGSHLTIVTKRQDTYCSSVSPHKEIFLALLLHVINIFYIMMPGWRKEVISWLLIFNLCQCVSIQFSYVWPCIMLELVN